MAILLFLLGIIAVNGRSILQYGNNAAVLSYPANIKGVSYTARNPDDSEPANQGPYSAWLDDTCKLEQFDDDTSTGCVVKAADPQVRWGAATGSDDTVGMVGEFYATDIDTGSYTYYEVTKLTITFQGGCLQSTGMASTAADSSIYYTKDGTAVVNSQQLTAEKDGGLTIYSLTVDSDNPIKLFSGESIGFNIQTNQYCEGNLFVREFELEAIGITTVDPTASPSKGPTARPTTGEPTMAPTSQCKGQVTWGDPHYRMMAFDNDAVTQFNYQQLGWFYYIAPCDLTQFKNFPFFLLSEHIRCYWKGNKKGCIHNNKLILNTKPSPIIIEFNHQDLSIDIPDDIYQAEVSSNALSGNKINTNKNYKDQDGKRLEIVYNDADAGNTGAVQAGTLKLFYDGDAIVIQLHDVRYDALPRKCKKNTGLGQNCGPDNTLPPYEGCECGENTCEDLTIDIRNHGTFTYFGCPHCLRNVACGLMGKYYRGDCTQAQLYDKNDKCSEILVGSDGNIYRDSNGRAKGDDIFADFADTWQEDVVKSAVASAGYTITWAQDKEPLMKHMKRTKPFPEGRSLDITDASYYDGYCQNNMTHIKLVNETCRQETVVKYDKCCKEIGICKILWLTCIEDYCSCTEPATVDNPKPDNITDAWCLQTIIQDSMNATCSVDALWPTSTPTATPTKSPTGLVAGLPQGQKAQDLIWLYLIFVVLFVVIAGVAYWYYRKKNGGKATFQDDVETGVPNTGVGY